MLARQKKRFSGIPNARVNSRKIMHSPPNTSNKRWTKQTAGIIWGKLLGRNEVDVKHRESLLATQAPVGSGWRRSHDISTPLWNIGNGFHVVNVPARKYFSSCVIVLPSWRDVLFVYASKIYRNCFVIVATPISKSSFLIRHVWCRKHGESSVKMNRCWPSLAKLISSSVEPKHTLLASSIALSTALAITVSAYAICGRFTMTKVADTAVRRVCESHGIEIINGIAKILDAFFLREIQTTVEEHAN